MKNEVVMKNGVKFAGSRQTLRVMWKMKSLYILLIIPLAFIIVFSYFPMYGVVIAFKDYRYADGILGSRWIGLEHFKKLFSDVLFTRALRNSLKLGISELVFTFPVPIIFAILLNEIKNSRFKRVVQTITSVPNFLSWVIVGGFVYQVLSPEFGIVNIIRDALGLETVFFMGEEKLFLPILMFAYLWRGTGWKAIIYLASMSSIDPGLYESAELDGANRLQKAIYITLPSIAFMVAIQLISETGGIIKNGLDPILTLGNGMLTRATYTLEYFSYSVGLVDGNFDYATAIGLFQNVVGLIMVITCNKLSKRISEYGLW